MEQLGIYRESGHKHFNGSIVIPIFDSTGAVAEMYGRKITPNLREGTPDHLYLPGAHRGVWNEDALSASKEIILCEALIDALTFWTAGFHNVTASYGVNGFTEDHRRAFEKHGTERAYIAYDRDEAGEKAAAVLAEELIGVGLECFRVQFPKGMDANKYARKVQPAAKSLAVLLNKAEWLGKGKRPAERRAEAGCGKGANGSARTDYRHAGRDTRRGHLPHAGRPPLSGARVSQKYELRAVARQCPGLGHKSARGASLPRRYAGPLLGAATRRVHEAGGGGAGPSRKRSSGAILAARC
ncbi:MAG: toprim domain-containing protein [Acidobacteriaceae bacterium]